MAKKLLVRSPSKTSLDIDLLVATTRKSDVAGDDGDEFSVMRVGELRRRLHKKGLDVDGSREAMIAALQSKP